MPAIIQNHTCVCGSCKIKSKNKGFVAFGKKTKFILVNSSLKIVNQYIVDDCLLITKLREEKCDFLFLVGENKIAYLIECKGSDILKAVGQLNSTLDILKSDLINYTINAKIIPTKVFPPDIATVNYKNLRKRLNGNLEIKNIVCTETI